MVTLGIIGVVSAMTVPTLMQNHQRKTYVTQLHKVYNELQQALMQYQNDKNAVNLTEAGLNSVAACNEFVSSYFKIVQTCTNALTPCFEDAASYKTLNGGKPTTHFHVSTSYVIASGASVRFWYTPSGDKIGNFIVDINGKAGPNIFGRDVFNIAVFKNGLLDDGAGTSAPLTKEERENLYSSSCKSDLYGCFGKILNDNWEMSY